MQCHVIGFEHFWAQLNFLVFIEGDLEFGLQSPSSNKLDHAAFQEIEDLLTQQDERISERGSEIVVSHGAMWKFHRIWSHRFCSMRGVPHSVRGWWTEPPESPIQSFVHRHHNDEKKCWHQSWDLINEQIYTGSPIDSEWHALEDV